MREYTNSKIIISGSQVESYEHSLAIGYGPKPPHEGVKRVREKIEVTDEESRERKEESRNRSRNKSRTDIVRLIHANAWKWKKPDRTPYPPVFMTLTFRKDIRDLKEANYIFSKFIHRLNFQLGDSKKSFLKYLVVPEFQDKNRKGVVHYHAIFFNLEFIWKHELEEVWDEGFAKIRKIDNLDKAIGYVCKYITKEFDDRRLDGQKRFFPSTGLNRPIIIRDGMTASYLSKNIPKEYLVQEKEFQSHFLGSVKYKKYRLGKDDSIADAVFKDLMP